MIAEGKLTQVTDIDEFEGINRSWIAGCENGGCIHMSNVEPIPLTPEILEKNGFEKWGNHSWYNEILRQIYVRIVYLPEKDRDLHSSIWHFDFPCVVSAIANGVSFRCDYIHELQHVLKLCCIKKEIKL